MQSKESAIISACLTGKRCRFDGGTRSLVNLDEFEKRYNLITVCPEIEGGLKVPRPKAWLRGGAGADVLDGRATVVDEENYDVTGNFITGAYVALRLAVSMQAKKAILKSKSPSCGYGLVYCDNRLIAGNGVTAELLIRHGVEVIVV